MVLVKSPRASGRSYGARVRSTGIGPCSLPSPRGVISSIFVPSTVSVLIDASVRLPSATSSSTVKLTSTFVPSNLRLDTLPTDTPADGQPRYSHVTVRLDSTSLGKIRRIARLAGEEGNLLVGEDRNHQGNHDGDADQADPDPVALGEGLDIAPLELFLQGAETAFDRSHFFGKHRPVTWLTSL